MNAPAFQPHDPCDMRGTCRDSGCCVGHCCTAPARTPNSAAEAMLQGQIEECERAARYMERTLRKFLAGALCAQCGEPLGEDREIVMDDDERTIHKECERPQDDDA